MDALRAAIRDMETLSDVDGDELKINTGTFRVWLINDEDFFVEELVDGKWEKIS